MYLLQACVEADARLDMFNFFTLSILDDASKDNAPYAAMLIKQQAKAYAITLNKASLGYWPNASKFAMSLPSTKFYAFTMAIAGYVRDFLLPLPPKLLNSAKSSSYCP
jgi:hypothetical protein